MIKIVQLASNPIGGSPYELNNLLNEYSDYIESRLICGSNKYSEGYNHAERQFPGDLNWFKDRKKSIEIIQKADILHCHNCLFPSDLLKYKTDKQKIILHLYSVHRKALERKIKEDYSIYDLIVISDQKWQKEVYKDLSNIYLPIIKSQEYGCDKKNNDKPVVLYAPTNRHDKEHIYSKGYHIIIPELNRLKNKYDFNLKIIEGMPYKENLLEKNKADIIIDDIINKDAFHGTSLEAACFGAVALTNYSSDEYPFYKTNLDNLERNIKKLLKKNNLQKEKDKIIEWRNTNYTPKTLVKTYEDFYLGKGLNMTMDPKINNDKMKKAKEEIFHIMSDWLDEHNIFYFLNLGTLLKSYRDKNYYSTDIDLGLFVDDRWKIKELLKTNPPKGIEINCLWRMEFTFRLKSSKYPKLDFNFYEYNLDTDKYQTYLYSRNPINGFVDWERCLTVSAETLHSFEDYTYFNKTIKIPENIDMFLTDNYGDWHIDKPNFTGWGGRVNANRTHREIAVIVTTFLRDDKIVKCIDSLRSFYPDDLIRIYIGDQNEKVSDEMMKYYDELNKNGHKIFKLEYNCGLAYARNYLASKTVEPFILVIDDDFIFTKKSDITKFRDILEDDENIGIAGGKLEGRSPYLGWFCPIPSINKILKVNIFSVDYKTHKTTKYNYKPREVTYYDTDIVLNFALYKRELFYDINWDNDLVLVEHSDFFLRLKDTDWKVAYTPEVEIAHNETSNSKEYNSFRRDINVNKGLEIFCKKWDITALKDICNVNLGDIKKPTEETTVVKNKIENKTQKETIIPVNITASNKEEEIYKYTSILKDNGISVILMKDTCKCAVLDKNFNNIKDDNVYLGVTDIHEAVELTKNIKPNLNIKFIKTTIHTKTWLNDSGYSYVIPSPVVKYLKDIYGITIIDKLKKKGRI